MLMPLPSIASLVFGGTQLGFWNFLRIPALLYVVVISYHKFLDFSEKLNHQDFEIEHLLHHEKNFFGVEINFPYQVLVLKNISLLQEKQLNIKQYLSRYE